MKRYLMFKCRGKFLIILIMEVLKVAGTIGVAAIISTIIDTIYGVIRSNEAGALKECVLLCLLYTAVFGIIVCITEKIKADYVEKNTLNIRKTIFDKIMKQSLPKYDEKKEGDYLTLLNTSIGLWEENCLKNFFTILEFCLSIVMAVVMLLKINPLIMIISIGAMSIPTLIPKIYSKKLANDQKNILEKTADYTSKIKDYLQGYEVIQAFQSENEIIERYNDCTQHLEKSKKEMSYTMARLYGISNFASIFVQFSLMLLAGYFTLRGYLTIGNIIAVTQLSGQVISPAFQLSTKITQLKSVTPVLEQLQEIWNEKSGSEKETAADTKLKKEIRLEHLSFSYKKGESVILDDISYVFEKGKKYALIGESGSGKSTLLKIIGNIFRDYSGKVYFDDRETSQWDATGDITMIHQNIILFDDTIKNNITLYKDYSEKEIQEAIKAAGLEEMIGKLPLGMETLVEEHGKRFSGGQRQRIAIAQALLHKKSVVLIDEATSSLDEKNTKIIEEAILSLKDTTSISITHKMDKSVGHRYDKILRLENGKLMECLL